MMRILVTGFTPFGADSYNASAQILAQLPSQVGDNQLVTGLLPVSFTRAAPTLRELILAHAPDALVLLGEAGSRTEISLESWAVNENDARIADNDGNQPRSERISPTGPQRLPATLNVSSHLALSADAGRFVCNHIAYHAYASDIPAQFIHVPAIRPGQAHALVGAETDNGAPRRSHLSLAQLTASIVKYLKDIHFQS